MKWLCVFLLLANAVVYGWGFNQRLQLPHTRPAVIEPLPADAPGIELLSELTTPLPWRDGARSGPEITVDEDVADATPVQPGAAIAADEPAPDTVVAAAETAANDVADDAPVPAPDYELQIIDTQGISPGADVCISAGPFLSADDAQPLSAWLRSRAARLVLERENVTVRKLYWVYLEPVDDAVARQQVQDLREKGVKDYLLIKRDEVASAISLGLFSSQDAVNRRLAELERKGYRPVVVPQFRTRDEFRLYAELAQGFEDPAQTPVDAESDIAVATISCADFPTGYGSD
ncbi:MAG: SPOR domain-containing protein [Gammaproteobacteria bacterium]|nr:SPOR domain-containing protein [Gammaproteobacteria bacterium]